MPEPSRLCPSAAELRVEQVVTEGAAITIHAVGHRTAVPCPGCGTPATRVQSRYPRTLADLPWQGARVRLAVTVRRFYCEAPGCGRRIFAERLPETAAPHARRTRRAAAALEAIGFATGGRPGARLALALGLAGAAGTVLAQVRRAATPTGDTPRILGVDDWSLRRGLRYGTILVDLERHRVVDLLPDREAATFAAWLAAHPGVAVISRDRGGAYAEGARQGAPNAIQVADRFHLVHNLVDALDRACTRHHRALRAAADACGIASAAGAPAGHRARPRQPGQPVGATADERRSAERRAKRLARYEQIVALRDAGHSKQRIARELGLTRGTVARWLAAGQFPERAPRPPQPRVLERFRDEILARYDAGLDDATALWRELRALGFTGSYQAVRRDLARLRTTRPRPTNPPPPAGAPAANAAASAPVGVASAAAVPLERRPSPRETAWLLRKDEAALTEAQRAYVTALCAECPALGEARTLGDQFVRMLHERDVSALDPWLIATEQSELRAFAAGLQRDRAAVLAALRYEWSNGQVEGQINRLKLTKRAMFNRAGFALLRARVLHAA